MMSPEARKVFLLFGALLLSLHLFSATVLAQEADSPPVARLITSGEAEAANRPRRVSERANQPGLRRSSERRHPSFEEATEIERRAFQLTNEARVERRLNALTWDPELCHLARVHSEKMARNGFFSHATPEGQRLKDRALAMGIPRFRVIAENIAFNQGYEDPAGFAFERWMTSSGHRANILYSGFQTAAVGVFVASDGSVYLTQAFIAR